MKKFFKITFFNLLIIFILLIIGEFYCIYKNYKIFNYSFRFHLECLLKSYKNFSYINTAEMRKESFPAKQTTKKPLAIMGCSFAYGLGLKEEETLSALLSKETNRIVYNLGVIGGSPKEILYILRNDKLRNELFGGRNDFEYIIYPYISDHIHRLYRQIKLFAPSPSFRRVGDTLEFYEADKILLYSHLYREITDRIQNNIDINKKFNLMCIYLHEINKEIKKHFPNSKFVICIYYNYSPPNDISILNSEEIKIIDLNKLVDIDIRSYEYKISQHDGHPNAKAWEIITPALVKELNL